MVQTKPTIFTFSSNRLFISGLIIFIAGVAGGYGLQKLHAMNSKADGLPPACSAEAAAVYNATQTLLAAARKNPAVLTEDNMAYIRELNATYNRCLERLEDNLLANR